MSRLGGLATAVSMRDVEDTEAFVKACIKRSRIKFDKDEYEELVSCGLLILCELNARYDPEKDQGPEASFAGYAWYLLPRKLTDAWHGMHEEHQLRTQADGSRKWEYHQPTMSWDEHCDDINNNETPLNEGKLRYVGDFVAPTAKTTR